MPEDQPGRGRATGSNAPGGKPAPRGGKPAGAGGAGKPAGGGRAGRPAGAGARSDRAAGATGRAGRPATGGPSGRPTGAASGRTGKPAAGFLFAAVPSAKTVSNDRTCFIAFSVVY